MMTKALRALEEVEAAARMIPLMMTEETTALRVTVSRRIRTTRTEETMAAMTPTTMAEMMITILKSLVTP